MPKIRIAVVGFGGMGRRWAKVASAYPESCLRLIVDNDENKSKEAEKLGCDFALELEALTSPEIDAVVVATPNVFLAPITKLALKNGKHVLCEKPAGINSKEVKENIELSSEAGLVYMVGFNHRFHPALSAAKKLIKENYTGKLHFIRSVYGHGGRIGYGNEWRSRPELSGGGELLDQGVHLIDLAFWFIDDSFEKISGILAKNFWSQSLEDNAFMALQTRSGITVSLHASWTQWQKKFIWEVYGEEGYVMVEGLGGGYGIESLLCRKRHPETGNLNEEKIFYFPPERDCEDPDISLFSLWDKFINSIKLNCQEASPGGADASRALEVVEKIYGQGKAERP